MFAVRAACAITASALGTLPVNALMQLSVTTVVYLGTLLQNAAQKHFVGIAGNQGIQQAVVPTKASVIHVERQVIVPGSAPIQHSHQVTRGCATIATSLVTWLLVAQMRRRARTVGRPAILLVNVKMNLYATRAM